MGVLQRLPPPISAPAQVLFQDTELQGVRLRVAARQRRAEGEEAERELHEEVLDRATYEQRLLGGGDTASSAPSAPMSRRQSMAQRFSALKPFVIISLSYLLFTTTDGAVRMVVLLHAYQKGFSAMEVAIMFSFYEASAAAAAAAMHVNAAAPAPRPALLAAPCPHPTTPPTPSMRLQLAGVITNLAAGMMGAKWGIKSTLLTGLSLQLVGIGMLFGWQDDWSKLQAILYVTATQLMCGIAKDLTKLGGKTVTKLVTPGGIPRPPEQRAHADEGLGRGPGSFGLCSSPLSQASLSFPCCRGEADVAVPAGVAHHGLEEQPQGRRILLGCRHRGCQVS
jgi:hypothetical protein